MPNWKSVETHRRLIAAMLAAQSQKPDYRKIATYFGDSAFSSASCPLLLPLPISIVLNSSRLAKTATDTTYNSIEGQFRPLRKIADTLKEEVESGTRDSTNNTTSTSPTSNAGEATPKKPRVKKETANGTATPKKEKIISGRVAKPGAANKGAKNPFGLDGNGENGSVNMVNGIKEEVVSSGSSSYFGGDEDAVGEVDVPMSTGWEFSDMDAMSAYVMGGGAEGI